MHSRVTFKPNLNSLLHSLHVPNDNRKTYHHGNLLKLNLKQSNKFRNKSMRINIRRNPHHRSESQIAMEQNATSAAKYSPSKTGHQFQLAGVATLFQVLANSPDWKLHTRLDEPWDWFLLWPPPFLPPVPFFTFLAHIQASATLCWSTTIEHMPPQPNTCC